MDKIKTAVFIPGFAFGLGKSRFMLSFDHIKDIALECERLGYHSLWMGDHLMFRNNAVLECWTTLSALSAITRRIRLGTMVLSNSFRTPSVLAKMAATLDVISKGRLEFGIGAGVSEDEHRAYGIPFPKPRIRVERMKEGIEIIKKMWTEEKVDYTGKYYRIKEAVCEPKPLQKPYPPITIGGGGEKLTLRVTAEHANRYDWGFLPSIKQYQHKLRVLESHCSVIGRNVQEVEKSCWPGGQVFIALNRKELDEKVAKWKPKDVSLKDFEACNLIGTPDECTEKIQEYVDIGVTFFMLMFRDLPDKRGLRLFAREVADKIKPS